MYATACARVDASSRTGCGVRRRQTGGLACRSGATSGQVDTTHAPSERLSWASLKYCGYIAGADAYPVQQGIHAVVTRPPGQPALVPIRVLVPFRVLPFRVQPI